MPEYCWVDFIKKNFLIRTRVVAFILLSLIVYQKNQFCQGAKREGTVDSGEL